MLLTIYATITNIVTTVKVEEKAFHLVLQISHKEHLMSFRE